MAIIQAFIALWEKWRLSKIYTSIMHQSNHETRMINWLFYQNFKTLAMDNQVDCTFSLGSFGI